MSLSQDEKSPVLDPSADREKAVRRSSAAKLGHVSSDDHEGLAALGYDTSMQRRRSMLTILFQSLAIAAIPYGENASLIYSIYGGGPLSIFVGWIVVCVLDECIAFSLGELASRFPTAAGPYYWSYQLAESDLGKKRLSFITGWIWLIGNWTITLSVNFGFASLVAATISIFHPDFEPKPWQLLLLFWAICIITLVVCTVGNKLLPMVDTACAVWTVASILAICIGLSIKADVGRHSAAYALGFYTDALSGWGGFSFFIGLLPPAYVFSAIGMVTSMSEEVPDPAISMPRAICWCIPIGGVAGLFMILPICFTIPALAGILDAPDAQAAPYIFHKVMGTPGGALVLMVFVFGVTFFCSISITTAASRTTWAFARDKGIPFYNIWSRIDNRYGTPFWSLVLVTVVQMLLGFIELGSSSAFTAFISVGVFGLAVSYAIPIAQSLLSGRRQVNQARWKFPNPIGIVFNVVAILWVGFELVLFSMPTALPTTPVTMNYSSVVFVGFLVISAIYYVVYARKVYDGPPKSDGL